MLRASSVPGPRPRNRSGQTAQDLAQLTHRGAGRALSRKAVPDSVARKQPPPRSIAHPRPRPFLPRDRSSQHLTHHAPTDQGSQAVAPNMRCDVQSRHGASESSTSRWLNASTRASGPPLGDQFACAAEAIARGDAESARARVTKRTPLGYQEFLSEASKVWLQTQWSGR